MRRKTKWIAFGMVVALCGTATVGAISMTEEQSGSVETVFLEEAVKAEAPEADVTEEEIQGATATEEIEEAGEIGEAAEAEADAEAEPEADVEADADVEAEPEADVEAEAEVFAEADTDPAAEIPEEAAEEGQMGYVAVPYDTEEVWEQVAITNNDVIESALNIRDGADEDAEVIGFLYRGAAVWVLEQGDGWTEIYSNGLTGYVKSDYLLFGEDVQQIADEYSIMGVRADWDGVIVYSSTEDFTELGILSSGDAYPVVDAQEEHWIEIQYDEDETGYVYDEDVTYVMLFESATPTYEEQNESAQSQENLTEAGSEAAVISEAAEEPESSEDSENAEDAAAAEEEVYTEAEEAYGSYEDVIYAEEDEAYGSYEDVIYAEADDADAVYEDVIYAEAEDADDSYYEVVYVEADDTDDGNDGAEEEAVYVVESTDTASSYDSYDSAAVYTDSTDDYDYEDDSLSYSVASDDSSSDTEDVAAEVESVTEELESTDSELGTTSSSTFNDTAYYDANTDTYYDENGNVVESYFFYEDDDYDDEYYMDDDEEEDYEEEEEYYEEDSYDESLTVSESSYYAEDTNVEDYEEGVTYNSDDETLMASLIYCEAGNQPYEGMVAVGAVVENRVESSSFPDTVSDVIYQSGQFTPAYNGMLDSALSTGVGDVYYSAADDAMSGVDPTDGALYFNTSHGSGQQIGDHWFY